MSPQSESATKPTDPAIAIPILLAEHDQLYGLVQLRLSALDQHVPIAAAALTGVLAAVSSLSVPLQLVLLVGLPLSLTWLLRSTINHARSLEDALRGIEAIETKLNRVAGSVLLGFQSNHPSRNTDIGGRTGSVTIDAVMGTAGLLLGGSLYICTEERLLAASWLPAYAVFVGLVVVDLGWQRFAFSRYRYRNHGKES